MTRNVVFTPAADFDIDDHAAYIAGGNLAIGARFYSNLFETCDLLRQWPEMGMAYPARSSKLRDLRILPVKGFKKYLVFYRVTPPSIIVVRVLHSARDIDKIL